MPSNDVPEPYVIEELERIRREGEHQPTIQLPLPLPPPPKPKSDDEGKRVVILELMET